MRHAWLLVVASGAGLASCIVGSVELCRLVTHTGGATAIISIMAVLIVASKGRWIPHAIALLASSLVITVIKLVVGAERPPPEGWLAPAEGPSFPSGHAAATAAFWTLVYIESRSQLLAIAGLLHTAAVSVSRVVLGVHYPEDVVAGALLGSATVYMFFRAAARNPIGLLYAVAASSLILSLAIEGYMTPIVLLGASIGLLLVARIMHWARSDSKRWGRG